jgi:signal peptidase I
MEHPLEKSQTKTGFFNSRLFNNIKEAATIILISILIVAPIKAFIIQPFLVSGASMEPNFHDGEYLIINEIGWTLNEAERGDILVFKNPNDKKEYFIKRVIGFPGETVEIKNSEITIYDLKGNKKVTWDETAYLPNGRLTQWKTGCIGKNIEIVNNKIKIPEGQYFVLGDNRGNSTDSRCIGTIEEELVVGKVWIRIYPFKIFN